MIKVENLSKTIDGNLILDNCSMNVPKGSIYGLVGPNGAGKSTIMRHIVGSMIPDSGCVHIGDESPRENPIVKSKVAYIPDEIFYQMTDTINSLMKFYRNLYPGFDSEMYEKMISGFPALDKKKMIRSYSKGMQRQAAFLLSFCLHPQVMVLDEPLDGLDPVMRRQILNHLVQLVADEEATILISSHNLRELEDICDHVGIMDKGRIVIERALSDLQSSVSKVQIAFEGEMPDLPTDMEVMHRVDTGRVHTLILRGTPAVCYARLKSLKPILIDTLPLTLEEIFIYEMGGVSNELQQALF